MAATRKLMDGRETVSGDTYTHQRLDAVGASYVGRTPTPTNSETLGLGVAPAPQDHVRKVDRRSELVLACVGVALTGDGARLSSRARRARRVLRDRIHEVALARCVVRVCKMVIGEGGYCPQHDGRSSAHHDGHKTTSIHCQSPFSGVGFRCAIGITPRCRKRFGRKT
jgi:hypothetical protein